jgi:hypothetical protein
MSAGTGASVQPEITPQRTRFAASSETHFSVVLR